MHPRLQRPLPVLHKRRSPPEHRGERRSTVAPLLHAHLPRSGWLLRRRPLPQLTTTARPLLDPLQLPLLMEVYAQALQKRAAASPEMMAGGLHS